MSLRTPASEPLQGGDALRPVVHSVADPAPLGLAAFAMTTFALSVANANIWGPGADAALALALVYGGFGQLLAGMWEFMRKNTFGATAFSSFGAFWISYYVLAKFVLPGIPAATAPTTLPVVLGVFTLGWLIFTAYMTIASLRVSGAVALVFVLLTVTFLLLTIGQFKGQGITPVPGTFIKIGGYVGIATAAAAWYASFAGVTNETFKRTVLPVIHLGPRVP
jgi:succinate-acetate transporter protein